jgi:hypothetical protein
VHAAVGRLSRAQVGRHGQYGELGISRGQRPQPDACVAAEQLELVGPPLAVEARPDEL